MASPVNAALCALLATAFWVLLGYALTRRLFPRALALGAAAVVGWAVHSAATLPVFTAISLSRPTIIGVGALCALASGLSLLVRPAQRETEAEATIPTWAILAVAALALEPAAAILPKYSGDAVQFADAIFDHSKVGIIDAIRRLGLPPVDPAFGGPGRACFPHFGAGHCLAYYYLWHFTAAELALSLGTTGWEADIGLTWFTAFASLSLMMGIAVWLSRRSSAAIWTVIFAAAGSLWLTLDLIFNADDLTPVLWPSIGMAGWLSQATWAPQHVMSASCAVAALVAVHRFARRRSALLFAILVLVVVAGFESSTHVGGVTFAIGALATAPILIAGVGPGGRLRFAAEMAAAAALVGCFAAPFMIDQLAAVHARGINPLTIDPYAVFGEALPRPLRRLLDLPGYWLILLPLELPATYFAGMIAITMALRSAMARPEKFALAALACFSVASLGISWLLVTSFGENNDLGLRAIIPAEIILIASTAAGMTLFPRRILMTATAIGGLVLCLPDAAESVRDNAIGIRRDGGSAFLHAPDLWAAVRRHAAPTARVANNPLLFGDITPWPVNISWALLANRNSCFAGRELVLALAPLSAQRRDEIGAQFTRVFDGHGTPEDVADMAAQYGCDVVVLTAQDRAWNADPFTASPHYRLAETADGRWRIYVKVN